MGKRKIGEIYNKPIVEGDINLKRPNEIHKSELSGGGGNNSDESANPYYIINVYNKNSISNGSAIIVFDTLFGILNGVVFGGKQNGSTLLFSYSIFPYSSSQYVYIRAYQIFPIKREIVDPDSNKTIYIDTTSLESIVNMVTVNEEYCMYFCDHYGLPYEYLKEAVNKLLTDDRYVTEKEFYDFIKS